MLLLLLLILIPNYRPSSGGWSAPNCWLLVTCPSYCLSPALNTSPSPHPLPSASPILSFPFKQAPPCTPSSLSTSLFPLSSSLLLSLNIFRPFPSLPSLPSSHFSSYSPIQSSSSSPCSPSPFPSSLSRFLFCF